MGSRGLQLPTRSVPYPPYDGTQPCRRTDPEAFFPETTVDLRYSRRFLKDMCAGCEFVDPCRDYAVSHDVTGLWAGTTALERRKERQRLGIKALPVVANEITFLWQLIDEVDNGVRDSQEIAERVGCSDATVQRYRRAKAAQRDQEVA